MVGAGKKFSRQYTQLTKQCNESQLCLKWADACSVLLQRRVFEVTIVLWCFVRQTVFFVGPSPQVDVAAAFAAKGTKRVFSFVATGPTALRAHHDAYIAAHGSNAQSHFKRNVFCAVLQATILVLAHHAHPNHQAVATDLGHEA